MTYTKEPWLIRTLENFGFNVVHYNGGDKFDIVRVAKCSDGANADRIVACVNSCTGIADPSAIPDVVAIARQIVAKSEANGYHSIGDAVEKRQLREALAKLEKTT